MAEQSKIMGRLADVTYEFPDMDPDARLRELILYIATKCDSDPRFNATRLNKILFYADFTSFAKTGRPITGAAYKALDRGPAPRRLVPVRNKMLDAGELRIDPVRAYSYDRHHYVALRQPKLNEFFKASDIALVDEIIQKTWGSTASLISDFSHHRIWKIARKAWNELIPYEAMYVSDDRPTDTDASRAKILADKYGWDAT
jgi:hypothetical protein